MVSPSEEGGQGNISQSLRVSLIVKDRSKNLYFPFKEFSGGKGIEYF